MAHITANTITTQAAQEYAGTALPETRADALLRQSERTVKQIAPAPDPKTAEYEAAAKDAEMEGFTTLSVRSPGGALSSYSADGISFGYADANKTESVEAVVRRMMSAYIPEATPETDDIPDGYTGVLGW